MYGLFNSANGVSGYGGWGGGMMAGGFGLLCIITWIVVIVDLVLVGMWLYKQIKK